jgi:hypothetical protein
MVLDFSEIPNKCSKLTIGARSYNTVSTRKVEEINYRLSNTRFVTGQNKYGKFQCSGSAWIGIVCLSIKMTKIKFMYEYAFYQRIQLHM